MSRYKHGCAGHCHCCVKVTYLTVSINLRTFCCGKVASGQCTDGELIDDDHGWSLVILQVVQITNLRENSRKTAKYKMQMCLVFYIFGIWEIRLIINNITLNFKFQK